MPLQLIKMIAGPTLKVVIINVCFFIFPKPDLNFTKKFKASLLNLQHTYKLNEAIGKTVTMLVQSDQLALKYGGSALQSQNMQQILILVRILTQIGEFYLRHDKLADAEACCQEIASIHPMSYLYIYLVCLFFNYQKP